MPHKYRFNSFIQTFVIPTTHTQNIDNTAYLSLVTTLPFISQFHVQYKQAVLNMGKKAVQNLHEHLGSASSPYFSPIIHLSDSDESSWSLATPRTRGSGEAASKVNTPIHAINHSNYEWIRHNNCPNPFQMQYSASDIDGGATGNELSLNQYTFGPFIQPLPQAHLNPVTRLGLNLLPHPYGAVGDRRPQTVRHAASAPSHPQGLRTRDNVNDPIAPYRQPTLPGARRSRCFEPRPVASRHEVQPDESIDNGQNTASIFFQPMSSIANNTPAHHLHTPPAMNDAGIMALRGYQAIPAIARLRFEGISQPSWLQKVDAGFSPDYRGDISLANNRSEDIPDSQNCSLFLVNLPPALTTHELLAAMHKLGPSGRIYATHVNSPEPHRGHPGCAAKVVFFRRDDAHAFYARCAAQGSRHGTGVPGFPVGGTMCRVMWNRIKTSERTWACEPGASRVLLVVGPRTLVSERALTEFFGMKLQFQVDKVLTHVESNLRGDAVVEYRFGSYRCQAQAARLALRREFPQVACFFGMDPLEMSAWKPFEYYNFEKGY